MSSEVPDPVSSDVRHHVFHKGKPIRESIHNAYNYRKAVYAFAGEQLLEDQVQILPSTAAHEIGQNHVED
jgi:hypothetical protein